MGNGTISQSSSQMAQTLYKDHLLYVDGVLEQNPAGTDINMDTNNKTTEIHIGSPVPGVAQHVFAKGIIDEVAIFNTALFPEDIKAIMGNGIEKVAAVDLFGKLTTTWGSIKEAH